FSCSFIHMTRSYLFMASTVVSTTSIFLPYTTLFRSVVLIVVPDPPTARHVVEAHRSPSPISMRRVIRQQAPVLRTLGAAALLVGAARASREVALPLWGEEIGLSPATTSLIFGISGAVEMLLSYPAGMVMDRMGRRWVVVPSMLILGMSLVLLPLTAALGTYTAV